MGGGLHTKKGDFSIANFAKVKAAGKPPTKYLKPLKLDELALDTRGAAEVKGDNILEKLNKLLAELGLDADIKDKKSDVMTDKMLANLASLFDSRHDFEMIMSDKIKHSKDKDKILGLL